MHLNQGLSEGISPDLHEWKQFLWRDGRNVICAPEGPRKMEGWSAPLTPAAALPVRGIGQLLQSGGQRLFWGDTDSLYLWNTATVTDKSKAGGYSGNLNETVTTPASVWSMVEWGTWMVASNGVDPIQISKADAQFADLGGTPPATAEVLMKLGQHIVAMNTPLGPDAVEFSDESDPEDWVPVAANKAGNFLIRDMESRIIAGASLGGSKLAAYGENAMHVIQLVGAPSYIGAPGNGIRGIGAVSKKSIVTVGKMNYGFGPKGLFQTDGVSFRYIGLGRVTRTIMDELNWAQKSKVNGYHNAKHNEVIWYYPTTTGEPTKGVSYNYATNAFMFLDHGRTSSESQTVFQYPVIGAADGKIYYTNFGVDADGAAMTSYLESHPYPGYTDKGNPLSKWYKWISQIELAMQTRVGTGLRLRIAQLDEPSETPVFEDTRIVADPAEAIDVMKAARYWVLRLESDQIGDDWDLQALEILGKRLGRVY
jgi:hypothetical protein